MARFNMQKTQRPCVPASLRSQNALPRQYRRRGRKLAIHVNVTYYICIVCFVFFFYMCFLNVSYIVCNIRTYVYMYICEDGLQL